MRRSGAALSDGLRHHRRPASASTAVGLRHHRRHRPTMRSHRHRLHRECLRLGEASRHRRAAARWMVPDPPPRNSALGSWYARLRLAASGLDGWARDDTPGLEQASEQALGPALDGTQELARAVCRNLARLVARDGGVPEWLLWPVSLSGFLRHRDGSSCNPAGL